jgi:hypothetical protein
VAAILQRTHEWDSFDPVFSAVVGLRDRASLEATNPP